MTNFRMIQFSSICLIFLMGLVHASFLDGTYSEKYQDEKSGDEFSQRNDLKFRQYTDSIIVGSVFKEHFMSKYKSHLANLQCEVIDVCGECGGTRVDKCNVCGGNNRCDVVSCDVNNHGHQLDACGNCLLPDLPSWNNCSAVISIRPLVLDQALNSPVQLKLELSKSFEEGDQNVKCVVEQNNASTDATVTAMDDNQVTLSVPLESFTPEVESKLNCEGWTLPQHTLMVVNSLRLTVSSVSPNKISLGQYTKLTLMVHGIPAPMDLFCFVTNRNRTMLMIQPTNQIAGNPISSSVVCDVTVFQFPDSQLFLGVSFTRNIETYLNKMSTNNTITLELVSSPLTPFQADYSEDLNQVLIKFNQNIEGPADCSGVFRTNSLQLLGTGIKCGYRGNTLVVNLGDGATFRPGDILQLTRVNGSTTSLKLAGSGSNTPTPLSQESVHIRITQKAVPEYLVVGPRKVCQPSQVSVMVVPLTTEVLWYNWSLVVTEVDTEKWSQSSQRQRKNLLVWLGAREVLRLARQANLHFLPINTSLLMPNINYRIEVAARNLLGVVGPSVGLDLQLVENSKDPYIGLTILSPKSTPASQPLPLEARVTSGCGVVCLDNFKYQWGVTKNNRTTTLYSSWFKVTVPGHLLQDIGLYNITCIMSNNSITLAQADVQVLVEPAKIVLTVIPKNLILGTGQTLNLDVSNSLQNTNISSFQIFWRCMTVDGQECIAPGSKQLVSTIYSSALSNPKLKLPPGSLSVGRYKWTVAVVSVQEEDVVAVSSADVEVMPGHPPVLTVGPPSITSRTSLSYLTVSGSAAEVRPGCKLQWTSLPSLGCNLLPFGNASGSSKELTSGTREDLTLMLPASLLQPGTQYCLRFSTFYSAAEYAHADVLVQLDSIPHIEVLEVSPAQGEALITLFNFSTKRTTKFGSIYSFGYYPPTGSPVYVYSSAYFLSTKTILPVFSNEGSQVKTLLRVCSAQKVCSIRDGPLINTALPTSLTLQQVRYLSRLTSSLIASGDPLEAMPLATSVISTTKMLKDQSSNQILTSSITEAILERINLTSQRLDKDPSSRLDAILFLDSVTRVLPQLQLNDSSLTIVVAFRDKLASTPASKPNPSGRLQSQLVMEPRVVREKRQQSIPTDVPPETPNTVEIWLRTSEAAILSFSPSKSLEEKQKLLTNLDGYIAGLCQWLPDSRPIYLGSRVVNLSVQKLSTADNGQKVNIPNCPDKCDILPAKVHLGKEFISKFKRVNLDPICLTGFHFPFGSLDTVFKTSPGFIQLSSVYRLKILTYSLSNVFKEDPLPTLKLGFPLESPLPSPQHVIKCCIVVSNTWTADRCEMVQVNESAVTCRCPPYEYYSVFATLIPTTTTTTAAATTTTTTVTTTEMATSAATALPTEPPTTTIATTTTTVTIAPTTSTPLPTMDSQPPKNVAFRIAERFSKVVGENSTEFSNLIKNQLIEQLSLPKDSILDIYVTDGSILVTMALRNTQQMSAEECMMELAQALDVGQLNLRTADNQPLDVPRQPLQVLKKTTGEKSGLSAVFLASVSLGMCGLVAVYVTLVTIVTKHSRKKEALRAVQRKAADKVSRYSSLPLPHSLDGSSIRYGTWSGDDLDSGIYDSDAGKRSGAGMVPKHKDFQSTNF